MHTLEAALVLGLIVGAVWSVLTLKKHVLAQPEFAAAAAHVELVDLPDWMSDRLAEDIRAELTGGLKTWTFDLDLVRRVGQAAERCPWVKFLDKVQIERIAADQQDPRSATPA